LNFFIGTGSETGGAARDAPLSFSCSYLRISTVFTQSHFLYYYSGSKPFPLGGLAAESFSGNPGLFGFRWLERLW
jgi:hypothetical protein